MTKDICANLDLDIGLEKAWELWTQNSQLESWLTVKANVNPVIGGSYELFWDPANPAQNSTLDCKITGLETKRFLAFQWKGPVPYADLMNTDPTPTWCLVSFESLGSDKTAIRFRHSGWGSSERWTEARAWQEKAWRGAFAVLEKNFGSSKTAKSAPVSYIEIPAPELDKTGSFYSSVFGWKITPSSLEDVKYWMFSSSEGSLMGGFDPSNSTGVIPYLKVDDMDCTLAAIQRQGCRVLRPKYEIGGDYGFAAVFEDPSGNQIGLWAQK